MRCFVLLLITSSFASHGLAKETDNEIPIIGITGIHRSNIENPIQSSPSVSNTHSNTNYMYDRSAFILQERGKVGSTSASAITDLIGGLRKKVCNTLKVGDSVKLNLEWDAAAKIWGLGVSGNGGIEVTINCS